MAAKKGSSAAMHNLGVYYDELGDCESIVIKYYKMAANKGFSLSMNELGLYYETKKDYKNMLKWFNLAIKNKNIKAMRNLAIYYNEKHDYDNMIKYYTMAAEKNDVISMEYLGDYYRNSNDNINMIKWYKMMIVHNDLHRLTNIIGYYNNIENYDDMIYYCHIGINNGIEYAGETMIEYLQKQNKIYESYKIYKICDGNITYNDNFNKIFLKRSLKFNNELHNYYDKLWQNELFILINQFIGCNDISKLCNQFL
jgi:TPR repeat protein